MMWKKTVFGFYFLLYFYVFIYTIYPIPYTDVAQNFQRYHRPGRRVSSCTRVVYPFPHTQQLKNNSRPSGGDTIFIIDESKIKYIR
jgi:hypothetical protein